ncbi:hypothetical protein [Burkholderia thailandensis]|uniref:hypothetical protein n=1 Tax=Burkholderia thailandensis TaxID=57975 RepID=UPI000A76490B|nr:hypothetical protein [Burkholderia thailandensis]MCS6428542.1 hypothetical protein [Burkholderia thailandensis]MCS6456384.1 hypothetical protein [Burkholderia thailandensis]MCS6467611.1 hypothetical protein [Burkholderia thailandensis]
MPITMRDRRCEWERRAHRLAPPGAPVPAGDARKRGPPRHCRQCTRRRAASARADARVRRASRRPVASGAASIAIANRLNALISGPEHGSKANDRFTVARAGRRELTYLNRAPLLARGRAAQSGVGRERDAAGASRARDPCRRPMLVDR